MTYETKKYVVEVGPTPDCQIWHLNGKIHRDGGPAIVSSIHEEWWEHGKRHRLDGPQYSNDRGYKCWCIYDRVYETEEAFNAELIRRAEVEQRLIAQLAEINLKINELSIYWARSYPGHNEVTPDVVERYNELVSEARKCGDGICRWHLVMFPCCGI